jgi:nucleosome-remodeling factor subunit BPTF
MVFCILLLFVTAIKNVLKNEDLNPETQEKLLQLQKYQEQKLRDPVPQPSTCYVRNSPDRKRPLDSDKLSSEFEPPKKSNERDNSGYFHIIKYDV